ncbi:MAG TPA: LemA family protein [Candidatus Dojkabacteria bacterium]|nr:LemA family protein [Candidatus Dojkabacteria bacterium]
MKNFLIILGIIVVIGLLLIVPVISAYNSMVVAQENIKNQQAQVEVQLQRRYDLIPNLVSSVKGLMQQEQDIIDSVTEARTKYGSASDGSAEKVSASNELEGALSRLLVVIENYPDIKSDATITALMDELAGTENRISVERKNYNDIVTDYNKMIKIFPKNIVANIFGFTEKPLFESTSEAEEAPVVDFTE